MTTDTHADLTTADCLRRLRELLPPEAFAPNPRRLRMMAAHASLVFMGYAWIAAAPAWAPLASLLIGHSLACLAFVAHEVSHNAVVRRPWLKYVVSLASLSLNGVSPTMWNRLHNDAHHRHAGTPADLDRPYLTTERSAVRRIYHLLLCPSREIAGNPLVLLHFVTYLARNMAAVFYPGTSSPSVVPTKPDYRPRERWLIAAEFGVIAGVQVALWMALGRDTWRYVWASPVPLAVASAVLMTYVFTNHFLNPITHEHDVLDGTTSVVVPAVVDRLHCHFSYHTEHHLFPAMNSDYYPAVSRALTSMAGPRYRRLPLSDAWRQLWQQELFRTLGAPPAR